MIGKTYLRWHLMHATAAELSSDFVNENFNFYETTLRGTKQIKPRWKRVVSIDGRCHRRSARQTLCRRLFPAGSKSARARAGQQFEEALADRIKTLEWMDEPTKEAALEETRGLHG